MSETNVKNRDSLLRPLSAARRAAIAMLLFAVFVVVGEAQAQVNVGVRTSAGSDVLSENDIAVYSVRVSRPPGGATNIDVPFTVTGDAADYEIVTNTGLVLYGSTGVITLQSHQTSRFLQIRIINDTIEEGEEMLTVSLDASPDYTLGIPAQSIGSSATTLIRASDLNIQLGFTGARGAIVSEGTNTDFCVGVTNLPPTFGDVRVTVAVNIVEEGTVTSDDAFLTTDTNVMSVADAVVTPESAVGTFSSVSDRLCFIAVARRDGRPENSEMFHIDLSITETMTVVADHNVSLMTGFTRATLQIGDEDPIRIGFAEDSRAVTVPAGAGAVTLTVAISTPASAIPIERGAFSLVANTMDGTAIGSTDYVVITDQNIGSFGDTTRSQPVTITILDSMVQEGGSTFSVALSFPGTPPRDTSIEHGTAIVSIVDNEVRLGFAEDSLTVQEGAGTVALTVEISEPAAGAPIVREDFFLEVSTVDGTAIGSTDYTVLNQNIGPFGDTTRSQSVTITITDDMAPEDASTFSVVLSLPSGAADAGSIVIVTTMTTVTIVDDDPVTLGFAEDSLAVTVPEGAGEVALTVVISEPASGAPIERADFFIGASTMDGTADTADYGALTNERIGPFNNTTRSHSVTIAITDDMVPEGASTFSVALGLLAGEATTATDTVIMPGTAIVTIEDNDEIRLGFAEDSLAVMTPEGAGAVTLTVVISEPASGAPIDRDDFSIVASTADGTADGSEYTMLSNTTIGPFSSDNRSQSVTIAITDDMVPEGAGVSTFSVTLAFAPGQTPSNTRIVTGMAIVTIVDDDPVILGFAEDSRAVTWGENSGTVTLSVEISEPAAGTLIDLDDFSIVANTVASSADGGSEYVAFTNRNIGSFGDTNRRGSVIINIMDDDVTGAPLTTFTVALSFPPGVTTPSGVVLDPDTAIISIEDNEIVTVGFVFPCCRTGAFSLNESEPPRYSLGVIQNGEPATEPIERTVEVHVDFEPMTGDSISSSDAIGGGTSEFDRCISRDFCNVRIGNVSVGPGGFFSTTQFSLNNDMVVENDEQFRIVLTHTTNSTALDRRLLNINPSVLTVTIEDNDPLPVGFTTDSLVVTAPEEAGVVTLTVAISAFGGIEVTRDICDFSSLRVSTTGGTAIRGADYEALTDASIVPSGDGSCSLPIGIGLTNDFVPDTPTTFIVVLSAVDNPNPEDSVVLNPDRMMATVTIIEDDDSVRLGFTTDSRNAMVLEGAGVVTLTATILGEPESGALADRAAFSIMASTADGSAADGSEYTMLSDATIGPFSDTARSHSIAIAIADDMVFDGASTFSIALAVPAGTASSDIRIVSEFGVATVTIVDDEPVRVGFTTDSLAVTIGESSETATLTVEIIEPAPDVGIEHVFSIMANTMAGSADGSDYEALSNESVGLFSSDNRSVSVEITITDDMLYEGASTFSVALATPLADISIHPDRAMATITIVDDDPVRVGFTTDSRAVTVSENAGAVTLTVVISEPASDMPIEIDDFSIVANTMAGSADGNDYTVLTDQNIGPFGNATRSQSVAIAITNDMAPEGASTFSVTLSFPGAPPQFAAIDPGTAIISIVDPVRIGFAGDSLMVQEDAATADLTVEISVPEAGMPVDRADFSLVARTMDGTAVGGVDYEALDQNIGFGDTTRSQSVTITIPDDMVPENASTFSVALSFPAGVTTPTDIVIVTTMTTVTIVDNDPVTLGFADDSRAVTVPEGAGEVALTVVISEPASGAPIDRADFFIAASTMDGTADAADYGALTNERIGPFNTTTRSQSVTIAITDDMAPEGASTFSVELGLLAGEAPTAADTVIMPDTAIVTIEDNDEIRLGFAEDSRAVMVQEGSGTVTLTVEISEPASGAPIERDDFSLVVSTMDGTATGSSDYVVITEQMIGPFSSDNRSQSVTIAILDDMAAEPASTFSVALSFPPGDAPPPNVRIEDGTATIDIVDDDLIRIGFAEDSLTVPEGAGAVTLTVAILGVPGSGGLMTREAFYLVANTMDGTATGGDDYAVITGQRVGPFSDATRSLSVTIAIPDDMVPEGAPTFSVALSFPPGEGTPPDIAIVPARATITIEDDDPVTIGFAEDFRAVMVRESSVTATLTVVISNPAADEPLEHAFSIVANPVDGSADGVDDYPVTSYPVGPFGGATRSVSVEIAIRDDDVPEEAETFSVVLSLPSGTADDGNIVIAPTTATITIEDEDRVTVGFERTSYVESEDVGQFQVCVEVTSPPLSEPLDRMFPLSVNTRESEAANADYNPITNQVVGPFSDARRRECFAVGITDDTVIENTERFSLELSQPSGQALSRVDINPDLSTVTINDDEELLIGWSDPALAVFEGDVMVVGTVSILSTAMLTRDNIFVTANTVDGTAFGSTDYVARTNQLIGPFSSDTRSLPVEIGLINRETDDGTRTFSVTLTAGSGSPVVNPATLMIAIRDDPVRVSLVEPEPPALFIAAGDEVPQAGLNISTPRTAPLTVLWSITSGAASMNSAAPEDFVGHSSYPITGAVVVRSTAAETHSFDLPGLAEPTGGDIEDRFFTLTLTGASGGGLAGGIITVMPSFVTLGIAGIDSAPPRFEGLPWAGGQSRVWLSANEDLAILPPSQRMDAIEPSQLAAGAEVRGFTLDVRTGPSTGTVTVTSALYHAPRGIVLELARELTVDDGGVFAVYEYPGDDANDVPGIFDRALDSRTNEIRNQTTQTTITINYGVVADADSDGIPDATEARLGTNPLVAALPGELPAFAVDPMRGGTELAPAFIAYSGIREYGAEVHLGVSSVSSTAQTAATNIQAYYLSDTFGYDGGYDSRISSYGCTGKFPANYAAMVRAGGCETVDWSNVIADVSHRIGWLATSANGLWAVDTTTDSDLPEQFIRRVPELNMDSQRLFTTGNDVVVRASFDSTRIAATTLTLDLSRIPVGSTVATAETENSVGTPPTFSITSSFSTMTTGTEVWGITGLTEAGVSRLWPPSTSVHPMSGEYSLGLSTQTTVEVVPGADGFPPVVGRPQLTCDGNAVNVLVTGVACTLELPVRVGSTPETRVFTLTAPDDVPESIEVAGSGDTTATVMLRYPVVAATDPLAMGGADTDNDGIADAHDSYSDIAYLPVSVSMEVSGTAGARIWQHIRPVFSGQGLRAGDSSLARVSTASVTRGTVAYNDYAASNFDNLPSGLSVVYDFSIFGVDYAGAGAEGGLAGVIIPLPQSLRGQALSLFKYSDSGASGTGALRPFSTADGSRYGFAELSDGGCPDDDGTNYDFNTGAVGDCLVVYVVDGGMNDDDGEINSVVKDPLGLRTGAAGGGGGRRHSGGGFGLSALAALLLLLLVSGRRGAANRPS